MLESSFALRAVVTKRAPKNLLDQLMSFLVA